MRTKYLLAIPMALLSAAIVGCDKAEDGEDGSVGVLSLFDPVGANPSLCGSPAIPFPNNGLFSGFADPTLNIPNPSSAPFVTAANLTDGFSTTASIFTDLLGSVDFSTAANAILIFDTGTGQFLVPDTDFTVAASPAVASVSSSGAATGTCTAALVPLKIQPISQQRSRILIEPRRPLNPSTTYLVAVTKGLKSTDGVSATPNEFFRLLNSDNKICDLTGAEAGTELDCTDPNAMADAASRLGFLVLLALDTGGLNPVAAPTANQKLATLETARRSLVRPGVTVLKAARPTLTDNDLVIAWSFTTQSVGKTLSNLNTTPFAVPRALGVGTTGFNTAQASGGQVASYANLYAGTVSLPYFLHDPSAGLIGSSPAILATSWGADPAAPDVSATFLGQVPCGAFATGATVNGIVQGPSASTTICYPRPVLRSNQTVPLLVAVPNASAPNAAGSCGGRGTIAASHASTLTCVAPVGGWPVVIFQHGITRNRTDMIALAPTLAAAGFAVVAIDMPLHGLVDATAAVTPGCGTTATNALYAGAAERTFGVDYVNNISGAPGADGLIDCSGTHMVNLSSLITSRDNLRQAESDLLHLAKSVNSLNFDGDINTDEIAETGLRFAGQSLGAIVGTTVMGVDVGADAAADGLDEMFAAAVLNVPGGGLGKLLDASASFGPRIAAGLAASGIFEGSDTYETFVRFAQHLVDPADPINYAVRASANHTLLVTEVIGDAVVPNNAGTTCPAVGLLPPIAAVASTNDPPGSPPPASAPVVTAQAVATGTAAATLLAQCPPLVIPAAGVQTAITYQDETLITGHLSGTDALVRILGITTSFDMGSAPFASQTSTGGASLVVFGPDTAEHGTLLTPHSSSVDTNDADTDPTNDADGAFAAATCAQQKQTATFLATDGAVLPIGGTCP